MSTFRGYHGDGSDGWSSVTVASRCLHVGNVAGSMTEEKLRQQFSPYGRIEALKYDVLCSVCRSSLSSSHKVVLVTTRHLQAGVAKGATICIRELCYCCRRGEGEACTVQAAHVEEQHFICKGVWPGPRDPL